MTLYEMRTEILRSLGLPLSGDPDLTADILLRYLKDAHAQLAQDTFCYRRQVIVPTIKSAKKTITCTFSQAPSDGATFIVGSTSLGQTTYTFKDSDLSGTRSILTGPNYLKNLVDAINGAGQGTTCSADVTGYQTFTASYSGLVVTLTGIVYDDTLNTTAITGTVITGGSPFATTASTVSGVNGVLYILPTDVIHIDKVWYGTAELRSSTFGFNDVYEVTPSYYSRYSVDKIMIDGYNAGKYPLIIDVNVIPSNTSIVPNGIPELAETDTTPPVLNDNTITDIATPYGIPEMYHRILVYIATGRIMTEMFADTIDGAQTRIQSAFNNAMILTNKFKSGLTTW